jgi:hypothetical protein
MRRSASGRSQRCAEHHQREGNTASQTIHAQDGSPLTGDAGGERGCQDEGEADPEEHGGTVSDGRHGRMA